MYDDVPAVSTVAGVADILGVCQDTVRSLISTGQLRCCYVGRLVRIPRHCLIDLLKSSGREPIGKGVKADMT